MKTISDRNTAPPMNVRTITVPDEVANTLMINGLVETCAACADLHPVRSWDSVLEAMETHSDISVMEYLRSRNRNSPRCLYCRASTVTLVPLLGQSTKNRGMCRSCGRSWIENYEVQNVEILEESRIPEVPQPAPPPFPDWAVIPSSASYEIRWDTTADSGQIVIPDPNPDEPY